jgi:plastocyanin
MKKRRMLLALLGLFVGWGGAGMAHAATVNFKVTDVPGYWFDTAGTPIAGNRSLHIIAPGDTVTFTQYVESRHTVTSLI